MAAIGIFLFYILFTAFVLTVVIFVHEMGHYYFARKFGVKIEAFSIGFGKELFGFTDRRGMRWRICRFPIGGYVTMEGETAPFPDYVEQFDTCYSRGELWTRTNWQRALIAFGGPLANFLFAFLVLIVMFLVVGERQHYSNVSLIEVGLGADRSGIEIGDVIKTVNGYQYPDEWNEYPELAEEDEDQILDVVVDRHGELLTFRVDLSPFKYDSIYGVEKTRSIMGVVLGRGLWKLSSIHEVDGIETYGDEDLARQLLLNRMGQETLVKFGDPKEKDDIKDYRILLEAESNYGLLDPDHVSYGAMVYGSLSDAVYKPVSVWDAVSSAGVFTVYTGAVTAGFLYQAMQGQKGSDDFGGVIKIGEISGGAVRKSADFGYDMIFKLFAVLSVNIGLLNLIPFPMLDGGQIALICLEAIRKKPTSLKAKAYLMMVSFGLLLGFMILVNIQDMLEILGISAA